MCVSSSMRDDTWKMLQIDRRQSQYRYKWESKIQLNMWLKRFNEMTMAFEHFEIFSFAHLLDLFRFTPFLLSFSLCPCFHVFIYLSPRRHSLSLFSLSCSLPILLIFHGDSSTFRRSIETWNNWSRRFLLAFVFSISFIHYTGLLVHFKQLSLLENNSGATKVSLSKHVLWKLACIYFNTLRRRKKLG